MFLSDSSGPLAPLSSVAVRRLQRDLTAWESERHDLYIPASLAFINDKFEICSITFKPTEGPFNGHTIHLHAQFPTDYPSSPPTVRVMTPGFRHPNVFHYSSKDGAYICLDMIKPPEYYALPYQGWSAAYSLTGLVLQLYSFLIGDDNIDQEFGGAISRANYTGRGFGNRALAPATEFKCSCGFTHVPQDTGKTPKATSPPAPQPTTTTSTSSTSSTSSATTSSAILASVAAGGQEGVPELSNDLVGLIISHADPGTIAKIAEASRNTSCGGAGTGGSYFAAEEGDPLADIALRIKQEQELVCFYHKTAGAGGGCAGGLNGVKANGETDVENVLGFGVKTVRHRDGSIKSLSMAMDLLSYRAFEGGVRKSAWNVPFDAFIPLALNERHAACAMRLLPSCVTRVMPPSSGLSPEERVLEMVARLMNSLVVEMVVEPSPHLQQQGSISRHMSDAALKGFCHLHHLLLTVVLATRDPRAMVARCSRDVLRFVSTDEQRHKSRCPDLGVLLIKYVLVPKDVVPWSAFAPAFVRELLSRQVRWVGPALGESSDARAMFLAPWKAASTTEQDMWRLETHLKHSKTSLATVATEVFFVNALARPAGRGGGAAANRDGQFVIAPEVLKQLAAIKASYDSRNGEPPAAMFDAFSRHARSVLSISKWTEVLAALRLGLSPPPQTLQPDGSPVQITVADMARRMADTLRQAVLDSQRMGYHTEPRGPRGGLARAAPAGYMDWEKDPPVGVVSDEWK